MQPDLVCKITVQTPNGTWRGSGYPITPNRIITAAHVVADAAYTGAPEAAEAPRDITLTFGSQGSPVDGPVSVVWCGIEAGVDVAVLRCQLPIELQPSHALLTAPPPTPIAWHAQGYTDFGKTKRPGGKDAYDGTLAQFSETDATVPLGCTDGLVTTKQWAGGSGSVAFDGLTPQTALAVITKYQSGKKRDQLVAVPLCYLLNTQATREGFRRAIQFAAYERRRDYRNEVIKVVSAKLQALTVEMLKRVAQEINTLLPHGPARLNCQLDHAALAEATATAAILHTAVTDVVARLVDVMETCGIDMARPLAEVVDYVLPLNYAPWAIQRLRDQLDEESFGLIEDEVSTRTLAEIIMAGYDQQPAKFVPLSDGSAEVRGKTALDYPEGPEEGLDILGMAHSLLSDLVARQDTLVGAPQRPLVRTAENPRSEAELLHKIAANAKRLGGTLTGVSKMSRGRTVYCVLPAPQKAPERDVRKQVLRVVQEHLQPHVQQFIFVELMENPTDARESEVGAYIKARVLRAQPTQKP